MNDVIPLLHVLEQMLLTMAGQGAVDVAHRSQRHMTPVGAGQEEEEEVEEDICAQELLSEMGGFSTQRTGVEEQEHLVERRRRRRQRTQTHRGSMLWRWRQGVPRIPWHKWPIACSVACVATAE
ncbi:unnamed protein product [Staurois parvus]|uniref:Uncharacterized protein n=1 Tax=Staurois parvus TaxID=386267 RepID=A0ABN9C8I4_9NEOB|nr:unnamed protein product [Staurois parvus]